MKRKKFYDPYTEALGKFNLKRVRYIVIGMSGINYYASKAQETFATQDFDIFLKPTINNVTKAISILSSLGYEMSGLGEKGKDKPNIKAIVKNKKTIVATNPYGVVFELILAISGFTFSRMEQDATIFSVSGIPIKVAKLTKLLASKKIAGREKDKLFLKRFEILLKEKE